MKKYLIYLLAITFVIAIFVTISSCARNEEEVVKEVEVLHWWTSGGEAAALNVLKNDLEAKGVGWLDSPIAGGGGGEAMTVLRARATAGNPPVAVQLLGFSILDWAELGFVANLNEVAASNGWDDVVPDAIKKFSKPGGQWVASPVNVHSTNWVWANKQILDDLGIAVPQTWDEFIAALDAVQASGKIALAHGGQAWQDATIFDGVVISTGGVDFYRQAFVDLDPGALGSATMQEAFERMAQLRSYVDDNFSGRDWNLASALVIEGEAAFQIMGDWAKGEFVNAGKVPNQDFLCFRVPGTEGTVSFNSDQFVMFEVGEEQRESQFLLAESIMAPSFQIAFNIVKGSVPARTDISDAEFDDCGKKGIADLAQANRGNTLVGSMAHGHANPPSVQNAIIDVVTAHFNQEYDAAKATSELVTAVASAQ